MYFICSNFGFFCVNEIGSYDFLPVIFTFIFVSFVLLLQNLWYRCLAVFVIKCMLAIK